MPSKKLIFPANNHAPLKGKPSTGVCTGLAVSWCEKRLKGLSDSACQPDDAFATINHARGRDFDARTAMIQHKNLKVAQQAGGGAAGWQSTSDNDMATFLAGRDGVYLISLHKTLVGDGGHTVAFHCHGGALRYYDPNTGMWVIDDATDLQNRLRDSRQAVNFTSSLATVEELTK